MIDTDTAVWLLFLHLVPPGGQALFIATDRLITGAPDCGCFLIMARSRDRDRTSSAFFNTGSHKIN
jgi:hypothetical protein